MVLVYDPYIDRSSHKTIEEEMAAKMPKFKPKRQEPPLDLLTLAVQPPQKTKNSSDSSKELKTREELISEWVAEYMEKKQLLGLHWEQKFSQARKDMLVGGFGAVKECQLEGDYTFNQLSKC
jgi:hypothetical protein